MKVAWIGTGRMGGAMAARLLAQGHSLKIHNRTPAKAKPLIDAGAEWADSPANAAQGSEAVFTMVTGPAELREVVLGRQGVFEGLGRGCILVDCTTSSPRLAAEIAARGEDIGIACLDAPVTGGDIGARDGTLSFMVGGEATVLDRVRPLLRAMGRTIVLQGPPGSGQHAKMVNQIMIAAGMVAMCEGLVYARAAGLDLARVLESVSGGAAGSWSLTNYAPRILRGDFTSGFAVRNYLKDLRIALDEADHMNLCLPGLALAKQLYAAVAASGGQEDGTQSLVRLLARLSGRPWESTSPS